MERYTWAVNKTYTIAWQVSHKVTEEIYTYITGMWEDYSNC